MTVIVQYTSAEIFTENIEDAALQWVRAQCDHPAFDGVRIVQMPDVHAGNACNVGTTYRIGAFLNPDHVGVDIGCTISMHRLSSVVAQEDFAKSMDGIFSTSVCLETLDESPQAYKPMEEILRLIEPTAEVITMVKSRLNIRDIPK